MSERDPFSEEFDALSYVLREKGVLQFPPVEASELGVLPLRNTVVFPGVVLPISVGRKSSLILLEELRQSRFPYLIVVAQKDPSVEEVRPDNVYTIGSIARILRIQPNLNGQVGLLIQGRFPVSITEFVQTTPFLKARYELLTETLPDEMRQKALLIALREKALSALQHLPDAPEEATRLLENIQGLHFMTNFLANNLPMELTERQALLETTDIAQRAEKVLTILEKQLGVLEVTEEILEKVRSTLEKQQRDYILRQQIKAIQDELGESDETSDIAKLKARASKKKWPAYAQETFEREIERLERIMPQSPEYSVALSYIEFLVDLPWETYTKDKFDLDRARRVLDQDHYGMEKVKKRILEYLAVLKLRRDMKSPILCLVGPPGVGKTSLAASIARALGRKYVRMSLGGLHDEAEIRGHRRTYIGAMPGKILQLIKRAGASNPVFVLDEIDKIGRDFRGDPASALLEVLDPEQNNAFQDNYLEIPYDLSKVLFIATANTTHTLHPALADRMEIIELSGYTTPEKVQIAEKYLLPRVSTEHGLRKTQWLVPTETITRVIENYTQESGVRQLQRNLAALARWTALQIAEKKSLKRITISPDSLESILGMPRYLKETHESDLRPGVGIGLSWTPYGGDVLYIETIAVPGEGKLSLSGRLGSVMKESATIAYYLARAVSGVGHKWFKTHNIHLHVPAGAIPKDGPSAGVVLLAALVSLATNQPIRASIAMTGEITLRGKILPVGGIKEKLLAAIRAGIEDVVLPYANQKDVAEIEPDLLSNLRLHYVKTIEEVLAYALPTVFAQPATPHA
jgi:ATP-dependent Lon protease